MILPMEEIIQRFAIDIHACGSEREVLEVTLSPRAMRHLAMATGREPLNDEHGRYLPVETEFGIVRIRSRGIT